MEDNINKKCPNCGAPMTSEICPYCKNKTGLDTANAYMEYPVIDCKEVNLNFFSIGFPMIFAVSFGFFGFIFPLIFLINAPHEALTVFLMCSIFGIIGIVAFVIAARNYIRSIKIKKHGKEIEATVYGFMDDDYTINGSPAQIVKLLVTTKEGPRFILYQLGNTQKTFKVNSKIKLLVYQNIFMIKKDEKYYF